MKMTEATSQPDGKGRVLFYEVRTDNGTYIGSAVTNECPLKGDSEVTLDDAKKNALLWAAAPDLVYALQQAIRHGLIEKDGYERTVKLIYDALGKTEGI